MTRARMRMGRRRAASAALAVAVLLVAGCGWRFDPYDDEIRGTNATTGGKINFGQYIGPDGDGCWLDSWPYRGKVYCDLVSIGGLHWDAGDVRVEHSSDIFISSGFLCLRDTDGRPWCWEWSSDTPPRPARVPRDETFRVMMIPVGPWNVSGAPGFLCGQVSFAQVVCWTVGVDQPAYRQATHRFVDGAEWVLTEVGELEHERGSQPWRPPSVRPALKGAWERDLVTSPYFGADQRSAWGSAQGTFHAFNGQQRHRLPDEPRVVVTDNLVSRRAP